jgi:hypothetical protein
MQRYPWFSVDSTTWIVQGAAYAHIWIPKKIDGKYDYSRPLFVDVGRKVTSQHFKALSETEKNLVLDYFSFLGVGLGESEFKYVSSDYQLGSNEFWADRKKGLVEIVIKEGLCNSATMRCRVNLLFFREYCKSVQSREFYLLRSRRGFFDLNLSPVGEGASISAKGRKIYMAGAEGSYGSLLDEYDYRYRLLSYYYLRGKPESFLREYVKGISISEGKR